MLRKLIFSLCVPLGTSISLGGCGGQNPVMTPVGWWHDLSGGAIAANRPPPPGADLPYPKIYTIPPKPVLPSTSYRQTIETQLAQERDDAQRLAARTPIVVVPPPPPPVAVPPPAANADASGTAAAANATIPAADAPPPPPPVPAPAQPVAVAPDGGPALNSPLVITGAAPDAASLPAIPDAPPPPATFEGVPAEPAPTPPPPLPPHVPPAAQGAQVFFRPDDAVLDSSQTETIKDAASHRGKTGVIEVEGHGDAQSDTPAGQETALALALKRAQVIAKALEAQRVPPAAIRISATAFGRGASLRLAS
jgi:outer membrane protein OmpA-like peptidoglycan-associated protein